MADELAELVNAPEERLDVEHKAWLDLGEAKHRADLARHIAAIANFGGGYIVFGIDDDGAACEPPSAGWAISHDAIASITKKYLDPSVHCEVRQVTSSSGQQHAVVVVPPHGATPVCAKANGPEINGKISGIVAGAYYIRKPGPESAPIVAASEWRDLIRRCALHERSAILAAVTAALGDATSPGQSKTESILTRWAGAADQAYSGRIGTTKYKVPLQDCRVQLSYRVETEEPEQLPFGGFTDTLRQVEAGVDEQIVSGWSLFHVFADDALAPRWASDAPGLENDSEFLEASYLDPARTIGFDLWRISPTGLATTIREFWEDTVDFAWGARAVLDPKLMARTLGELVRHAEVFSAQFSAPIRVEFRCEWRGLRGRQLASRNSIPFSSAKPANSDYVRTGGAWPVGRLADKPQLVSELGSRVARAFDWTNFTPEWIAGQMSTWNRFG